MEKMQYERQKGKMTVYKGCRTPMEFYYDYVGWYDGFKFVFGRFKGDSQYRLFEVSTLAEAATPMDSRSPDLLVHSFHSKLNEFGGNIGRVVEKYNNDLRKHKTHHISIWLSTLIG